jgi:hypothetical protein
MPRQKRHASRVYLVIGEPGPGSKAVGYVRYSSDMQDPVSIERQKRHIVEYARKKGWTIVRWYEEPEQSAKYEEIEKRPLFAQLLAEAGITSQIVLCYRNDRWARNKVVAYSSLEQLRRRQVWWATADGRWDIDRIEEDGFDLAYTYDVTQNAAYVRYISKLVIDGKEDRARDGYHNGAVPFGYLPPEYPKAPDGAPSTWRPPRIPVRMDPINFPALVRIGELAAQGWADSAIADDLQGCVSTTPRFGSRALTKDTVAAIRRLWFPREFRPGCGHGTIETPTGELIEGRHPSAWPYELWQRMVAAKTAQYRRPRQASQRHPHEFSGIIVCAACRRPLRVQPYRSGNVYYRDTSARRKLPCPAGGYLMANSAQVLEQFGALLTGIQLPQSWREDVTERCAVSNRHNQDKDSERKYARRAELEAEQERLVAAFGKGYLSESDLDAHIDRIREELQELPPAPIAYDVATLIDVAISAGEALTDMASYWPDASPEERRDIAWVIMPAEGLIYDLERRLIAGVFPRPDMFPVLALALDAEWEQREGKLWRSGLDALPKIAPKKVPPPLTPPALTSQQRTEALALVRSGLSLRKVAAKFPGVSFAAIWRLMRAEAGRGQMEDSEVEVDDEMDEEV